MARPKTIEKGVGVTLWLDESIVVEIDRLADAINLTRSRFIRNLIATGLEDARVLDAMGLFKLMKEIEKCTVARMIEA